MWSVPGFNPNETYQHKDIGTKVDIVSSVDFDQNFMPINEGYPGATVGTYVVRLGDTLQSIAASVWGDSSLWYLIADANGLKGTETLTADMRLTLPNFVTNIHNTSSTHRIVDPGLSLGDTQPTLPEPPPPPKPKGKKGCGGIGTILVIIVAVVVTVFTAGAALAALAPAGSALAAGGAMAGGMAALGVGGGIGLGAMMGAAGMAAAITAGAVGAAAGSIVSQGLGMAMGMQDSFSWSQVGMAAIGGAVTGGLQSGGLSSWGSSISKFVHGGLPGSMAVAAVANVATQGLSMAAGLQKRFSWTQVAASAVGAGVGQKASEWIGNGGTSRNFANGFGSSMASGAAYSLMSHEKPNWGLIAANSFGQTVGNMVTGKAVRDDQQLGSIDSDEQIIRDNDADIRDAFDRSVAAMKAPSIDIEQVATPRQRLALQNAAVSAGRATPPNAMRVAPSLLEIEVTAPRMTPKQEQYYDYLVQQGFSPGNAMYGASRRPGSYSSDAELLGKILTVPLQPDFYRAFANGALEAAGMAGKGMSFVAAGTASLMGDYGARDAWLDKIDGIDGGVAAARLKYHDQTFGEIAEIPASLVGPEVIVGGARGVLSAGRELAAAYDAYKLTRAEAALRRAGALDELGAVAGVPNSLTATNSIPNLTERGTLTNLFPSDPAVAQKTIRTLVQDGDGRYWLQGPTGNRITPSGAYDFVTTPDGAVRVARPNVNPDFSTHLGLSGGGEVNFAGSIRFGQNEGANRGTISWWSNNSGHYQPPVSLIDNAKLPLNLFKPLGGL